MLITGGNSGIGKEIVKVLLQRNAKVYIACRSRQRGEQAIKELLEETGRKAHLVEIDLASLQSIKAGVEEFLHQETQLHALFHNGGVMNTPVEQLSADGYDLQFAVNCLAPFYMTKLLLPTLVATAETTPSKKVRVINTSSFLHMQVSGLDFDTFTDDRAKRKKLGDNLYSQSKYAIIVFSHELAKRYGDQGIVSIALHPGLIRTDIGRNMTIPPIVLKTVNKVLAHPLPMGVLTPLRAGTAPEAAEWNGKYLIPWARLGEPHSGTSDAALGQKLWEYMEDSVKDV